MMFIVVGHVVMHGFHGEVPCYDGIRALTVTGVNLFVLISGWFNIRLTWKSLLNLLGLVLFYQVLSHGAAY